MDPGTRVGPYEIIEQLGAGGMGEVYLAEDTRLHRKVAIKVLPQEYAADPERLARFEQEARAAAALNHPHIAAIHDVGEDEGTPYIVEEYLEGSTLRHALDRGKLPLRQSLELAAEFSEALAAAHDAGIVHRDLKPENTTRQPRFAATRPRQARLHVGESWLAGSRSAGVIGQHLSGAPSLYPRSEPCAVCGSVFP